MCRLIPWIGAILLLCQAGLARAQTPTTGLELIQVEQVHLDDVHAAPGGERVVDLYFRALNRSGAPAKGIRAADVELWEDGERIDPSDMAIESLGTSERGVAVVLAIDVSGTMLGERFQRAREAALAALERGRPQDKLAVVTFAEDVRTIADFQLSRVEARRALRELEIDRERSRHTLLYDGAYRAVELIRRAPGLPRRAFVILFSDGRDGGSDRSREQVVQAALGRDSQPHILIFSIGYAGFGREGLEEMRKIAEGTGGEFLEAASVLHLRDFFDDIAIQMFNSYVLRFRTSLDGEEHRLRVTIDKQSEEKAVLYPSLPEFPWRFVLGALALALTVAAVLLLRRGRIVGRLSILSGPSAGTVIAVRPGKTRIGALEENEVTIALDTVSRYHAEIVARGRQVEIADLRSKNGTRVNGQAITRAPLRPGDKILVADVELAFDR